MDRKIKFLFCDNKTPSDKLMERGAEGSKWQGQVSKLI